MMDARHLLVVTLLLIASTLSMADQLPPIIDYNSSIFASASMSAGTFTLSQAARDRLVKEHNTIRSRLRSSEMQHIFWNDDLAAMALRQVTECDATYMPNVIVDYRVTNSEFFKPRRRDHLDISEAIYDWYDTGTDLYNHTSRQCPSLWGACDSYLAFVNAHVTKMGCAAMYCPNGVLGSAVTYLDGIHLICFYGPIIASRYLPFTLGRACSECVNGKAWCWENLCRSECTGYHDPTYHCVCTQRCINGGFMVSENCTCHCRHPWIGVACDICPLNCVNGGTLDAETCFCHCPSGWGGDNCEICMLDCQNRGTVVPDTCTCACAEAWQGPTCNTCVHAPPCANGGSVYVPTCTCHCVNYWRGNLCEECGGPCAGGNGYAVEEFNCTCYCDRGWSGPDCDHCNRTCHHGGTLDPVHCTCSCIAGWTGGECQSRYKNCWKLC